MTTKAKGEALLRFYGLEPNSVECSRTSDDHAESRRTRSESETELIGSKSDAVV